MAAPSNAASDVRVENAGGRGYQYCSGHCHCRGRSEDRVNCDNLDNGLPKPGGNGSVPNKCETPAERVLIDRGRSLAHNSRGSKSQASEDCAAHGGGWREAAGGRWWRAKGEECFGG